ncbi:MAG: SDR family NAD(P)-dependent oxidoreductase [Cyclobacteriaceae bacterium]|nr:SDR family NAD(P)-dependent oxidoreductase [Cyclobacteriaceae bacterium]
MISPTKYGQWACVAGAAEGLGAAFAQSLASRGMNLILVDKNKAQLELTAKELRIHSIPICCKLWSTYPKIMLPGKL